MSTVKEHLRKFHEKSAEHHLGKAQGFKKLAKAYGAMKKVDDNENTDVEDALEQLAENEMEMGEYCVECAKTLSESMKAAGMSGDELMPDNVFGYLPEVPSNIRPVLRAGQRDISEMSKVDPALESLVKIDD